MALSRNGSPAVSPSSRQLAAMPKLRPHRLIAYEKAQAEQKRSLSISRKSLFEPRLYEM